MSVTDGTATALADRDLGLDDVGRPKPVRTRLTSVWARDLSQPACRPDRRGRGEREAVDSFCDDA